MKDRKIIHWQVGLIVLLILPSVLLFTIQIHIFKSPRETFFYLLQDLAFVPVQVLIVTLLINQVMAVRERRSQAKRLNMIIGVYFSETGNELVRLLTTFDMQADVLRERLQVDSHWKKRDFQEARKMIQEYQLKVDSRAGNLARLKDLLVSCRPFLLSLLENSNLLEHQSFTDTLWTVFHLTDELAEREHLESLPEPDLQHLGVDITRAYRPLLLQWLGYMEHLKEDYPFLFSLAVRKSPFKTVRNVIIG